MKLHDLTENVTMLESFKKDIRTIDSNKENFFFDRFSGNMNIDYLESFEQVKQWKLVYAFEDSCAYAKELAMVLKSNDRYGVISYYNAGQSIATNMKVVIMKDKEELREFFDKVFIFNGLDDVTDKRIAPRFDFHSIIDNFPELMVKN